MKKFFLVLTVILGSIAAVQAQAQKMAFVNTQLIMDTLPSKDSAELKLQAIAMQYDDAIKSLTSEIQAKQAEYEAKTKSGGQNAATELLRKRIESLYQDYQETEQVANRDIQMQRANLLKPIVDDIKVAIGVVAAENGYTAVIDNAAQIVLWTASDKDDITAKVIAHMLSKSKAAVKPATPAAGKPAAGKK